MRNRFIPISRRRERIHWKPATNFLQRRHCSPLTPCSALPFKNMREQRVTRGYRGYEGGVLEGLSEACDRFYNLIGCLLVHYFLTCFSKHQKWSCRRLYLNNGNLFLAGKIHVRHDPLQRD